MKLRKKAQQALSCRRNCTWISIQLRTPATIVASTHLNSTFFFLVFFALLNLHSTCFYLVLLFAVPLLCDVKQGKHVFHTTIVCSVCTAVPAFAFIICRSVISFPFVLFFLCTFLFFLSLCVSVVCLTGPVCRPPTGPVKSFLFRFSSVLLTCIHSVQ